MPDLLVYACEKILRPGPKTPIDNQIITYMKQNDNAHSSILSQIAAADLTALRSFLLSDPERPLIATGSGGSESVADFLSLLYGARGGVAVGVSPYTFNSYSDAALRTAKLLVISKGGHNKDALFAARRSLKVNPSGAAAIFFGDGDGNHAVKLFRKAKSDSGFVIPLHGCHDGFISSGSSLAYFSLMVRLFQPDVDLRKYYALPQNPFTLTRNDGAALTAEDLRGVHNVVILHGSWGRPVAKNLESKLVETGLGAACVCDYRNYCHGRFIFTSQHLDDSAMVMIVSPREKDLARRVRAFLPAATRLILIETAEDAPEATLDLLIRAAEFYRGLCHTHGVDPYASPANPGRIDKRIPIGIPFTAEMKRIGPLTID